MLSRQPYAHHQFAQVIANDGSAVLRYCHHPAIRLPSANRLGHVRLAGSCHRAPSSHTAATSTSRPKALTVLYADARPPTPQSSLRRG